MISLVHLLRYAINYIDTYRSSKVTSLFQTTNPRLCGLEEKDGEKRECGDGREEKRGT
jgi:hypothetical protein